MPVADELDALIDELDQAIANESGDNTEKSPTIAGPPDHAAHSSSADPLDLILGSPPRSTRVKRLRDSDVVQQFRRDLLEGTVRTERLVQFLAVVGAVVKRVLRQG